MRSSESIGSRRMVVGAKEHVPGEVKFLVCVDRRPQSRVAVLFACRRAEAERPLHDLAAEVNKWAGVVPETVMRVGDIGEQVPAYIDEDPTVNILVVGASSQTEQSFSLVIFLAGRLVGNVSIPLVIVQGNLSDEQIVSMT